MWLACAGLGLGCTAKNAPPSAEESPPEPELWVGARVILEQEATVYRHAKDAVGVQLAKRPDARASGYAVEVLTTTATRVEVRTLGPEDPPACATNFEFADDIELRFWVERDQLRQMLVAPMRTTFDDGTNIALRPGVPVVEDTDDGRPVLQLVGGQTLDVPLTDAEVGLAYDVPALVAFDEAKLKLQGETELRYGAGTLLGGVAPFERASGEHEVRGSESGERLLEFDNACGRFTLRGPAGLPSSSSKSGLYAMKGPKNAVPRMARNFDPDMAARNAGILGVMEQQAGHFNASPYGGAFAVTDDPWAIACKPVTWTMASGTALSWNDGRPAGVVRRAHELAGEAEELSDRVCFELEGLQLCADPSKLAREDDPDCVDGTKPGLVYPGKTVPEVRQGNAKVGRGLDPDIVRRIVRAHINEVRSCYSVQLRVDASLKGRIVVAFDIAPSGRVARSEVRESTMASAAMEACIVAATKRWKYPKPKGDEFVEVVYPFRFAPG